MLAVHNSEEAISLDVRAAERNAAHGHSLHP
jgi:hypothetical protein